MDKYSSYIEWFYRSFVSEYWMQIVGYVFIFFALWFSFKRRNFIIGTLSMLLAAILAYGKGIAMVIERVIHG